MEAQRGARPSPENLQQSLRPEPRDGINHCLPLENPAGHRKANRRVEQVHLSHKHPPNPESTIDLVDPQGRNQLQPHIGTIATGTHPDKAQQCYRSGTEVIGARRVNRLVTKVAPLRSAALRIPGSQYKAQCAGISSSVARPGGGTTTVDRLPSAVSF